MGGGLGGRRWQWRRSGAPGAGGPVKRAGGDYAGLVSGGRTCGGPGAADGARAGPRHVRAPLGAPLSLSLLDVLDGICRVVSWQHLHRPVWLERWSSDG